MSRKIYYTGEFSKLVTEWFPTFNIKLYDECNLSELGIDFIKPYVVKHRFHRTKLDELNYDILLNANISFLVDIDNRKVICFNTFWNLPELVDTNYKLFEEFDITLYCGHYYQPDIDLVIDRIQKNQKFKNKYEFKPWLFRPLMWYRPEFTYQPKFEKIFFRGLDLSQRKYAKILEDINRVDIDVSVSSRMKTSEFYKMCSQSQICLSTPGARDMCNRDIELMSMGVPMIRTKFFSELLNVKIPDELYFPINFEPITDNPRFLGMPKNHEKVAEDVITIWENIKGDNELLLKKSKIINEFYEEYFTNEKLIDFTYKIIMKEIEI